MTQWYTAIWADGEHTNQYIIKLKRTNWTNRNTHTNSRKLDKPWGLLTLLTSQVWYGISPIWEEKKTWRNTPNLHYFMQLCMNFNYHKIKISVKKKKPVLVYLYLVFSQGVKNGQRKKHSFLTKRWWEYGVAMSQRNQAECIPHTFYNIQLKVDQRYN